MPDSKVSKAYVRPDNTAVITCTHCGCQKVILVDSFKGYKHILKVKCVCQKIFRVNLEFRKSGRKVTRLKGTYINHSQKGSSGNLTIHDISAIGLGFDSLDTKNFKVGDELSVEFTLNDELQTEIKKEVIVRSVRQHTIGCEFARSEEAIGSPLGYYVMRLMGIIIFPVIISIHPFLLS